jgi:hypothetical protein|tara:strand:- start:2637 stop:3416 length:780 start_codon:yes stop_codon:yes gene_type:complete
MNGFERHKEAFISKSNPDLHLSASTFALATNAMDVFVAEKLFGKRGAFGAAPMRGIVIEDAAVDVLYHGMKIDEAIKKAEDKFDKRMMFGNPQTQKERDMIEPCVRLAVEALEPYGKPEFAENGKQQAISLNCKTDDWSIPFIGYLDFVYPEHGLIIDLKTTGRMPSVMPTNHQVQRAIYQKANGNFGCKFLYVTPKKFELKEDGDVEETLAYVKAQTIRLERFLNSGDKEFLRSIVPVDPSSFYWRGNEDARRELFGV